MNIYGASTVGSILYPESVVLSPPHPGWEELLLPVLGEEAEAQRGRVIWVRQHSDRSAELDLPQAARGPAPGSRRTCMPMQHFFKTQSQAVVSSWHLQTGAH